MARLVATLGACVLVLSSLGLTVVAPTSAAQSGSGLRQIGVLPAALGQNLQACAPNQGPDCGRHEGAPTPMLVDPKHHLGFAAGFGPPDFTTASGKHVAMYDLERLELLAVLPATASGMAGLDATPPGFRPGHSGLWLQASGLDPTRQRLYIPQAPGGFSPLQCGNTSLDILDYSNRDASGKRTLAWTQESLPCIGQETFSPRGSASYDQASDKIYLTGTTRNDDSFRPGIGLQKNNHGSPLIVAQLDAETLTFDWTIDLTNYGCGRWQLPNAGRAGDRVLSYCNDPTPSQIDAVVGRQGYVVSIMLDGDVPKLANGMSESVTNPRTGTILNAVVERAPAIPSNLADTPVIARVDPGSGRLLLATADKLSGNAIWVYDPPARRFIGVVTGGQASVPEFDTAVGLDEQRGIAYLVNPGGILAVPVRPTPVPTGLNHPVVQYDPSITPFLAGQTVAVDPGLRRLFVPMTGLQGYAVLEDDTPIPPPPLVADPDDLTTQIEEASGKTEANLSGTGIAFGARLLVAGGLPRLVNQNDPLCNPLFPGTAFGPEVEKDHFPDGKCLASQVLADGDNDVRFASSRTDTGTATGAIASAAGATPSSTDTATSASLHGQGLPMTPVECDDAGGEPDTSSSPSPPEGGPQNAVASAQVACDGSSLVATATSSFAGFALPPPPESETPGVSVARAWSSITASPTTEGQTTVVQAVASGVRIGPVGIAQVVSQARTDAHGRTGTAQTTFAPPGGGRQWCGITIPGEAAVAGCIDPDEPDNAGLIDSINLAVGRAWVTAPPPNPEKDEDDPAAAQTTPGGFQAALTKHPGQQASDQAVNNDTSTVLPGMQVIVYNDGAEGRSRQILQLAGVHAEARYGITPIPQFGAFNPSEPVVPTTVPVPDAPAPAPSPTAPTSQDASPVRPPTGETTAVGPRSQPLRQLQPIRAAPPAPRRSLLPAPGRPLPERILRVPGEVLQQALQLLVQNPREFGFLFAMWSLLAVPWYLAARRRALARHLAL